MRNATIAILGCLLLLSSSVTAYGQVVPEILYYPFEEGSGTSTANEADPGQGDATPSFSGTPTWVTTSPVGDYAVEFDSSSGLPTGFDVADLTGDFTLETWMFANNLGQANYIFGSGTTEFRAFTEGVAGDNLFVRIGGGTLESDTEVATVGDWVHVAVEYDASNTTARLYIDGVLEDEDTSITFTNTGELVVGGHNTGAFTGAHTLDQFRLFDHTRSSLFVEEFEFADNTGDDVPDTGGLLHNWSHIDPFLPARPGASEITSSRDGWVVSSSNSAGQIAGNHARFSYNPTATNYSLALVTPEIDVNDMPGTTLSFELHQRPWQETGDEYFEVWWIDQDEATPTWQRVFQDRNDKAQQVETVVLSIPDAAESTAVQLAFVVHGNNTGDGLWEWDIDNIVFGFADPASGLFARHRGDVVTNGGNAYEPATVAGAANFVGDLELENFGASDDVLVTSIDLTGESNVTLHTDDLSLPASALQPGESFELDNIYFTPDAAGAWSFTIVVESDASNAATYEIVVEGQAGSEASDLAGSVGQETLPSYHPNISSPRNLILDVHRDTVLRSVTMDAENAATVEVELRDRHDQLLHEGTFNLSGSGPDVVELDWFVPAGHGYRLYRVSSTERLQAQDNANYPYVSDTVTILGTDNNPSWYYFFYDIQFAAEWETALMRDAAEIEPGTTDQAGELSFGEANEFVYLVENREPMPMAAIDVEIDNLENVEVVVLANPGRIDAGETGELVLEVTPQSEGAFSFDVALPNSDPEATPFTFAVEGEGTEPSEGDGGGCALGGNETSAAAGYALLLLTLLTLGAMRRRLGS